MSKKIKTATPILRPNRQGYARVAGFDMGSTNTASTVLRVKIGHNSGKLLGVKHLHTQMMPTINDLTQSGFTQAHDSFTTYFESWMTEWKPDLVMAERFISRGLRGSQGEKVSAMLFTMATVCRARGVPFVLVAAQAWKNTFCRRFYTKEKLDELYRFVGKTKNAHRVDATLIALFAANGFEYIKDHNKIDQLIAKVKP